MVQAALLFLSPEIEGLGLGQVALWALGLEGEGVTWQVLWNADPLVATNDISVLLSSVCRPFTDSM